jgi:2-oxoglutarate ferredoxin oxidoreductase subunit gamma
MTERIIIAGAGGQGIMLLGQVLAEVAIKENKHVTWLPAYGAEVRGGTAHCMVVISDQEIGSPFIDRADTLIIMNGPSFAKFRNRIKNQGLFIINSSLVSQEKKKNAHILEYPFTDIALKLGNIRVANMVAVGCYLAKKKIMDINNVFKVIEEIAPEGKKDLIEINQQAVSFGRQLIKKQ